MIRYPASLLVAAFLCGGMAPAWAQGGPPTGRGPAPRLFGKGHPFTVSDLPSGPFRDRLQALSPAARTRALERLHRFTFPSADLAYLQADRDGGIYYADPAPAEPPAGAAEPVIAETTGDLPVSPFPEALRFHSRPGAIRSLYLDFDGEVVTGTAWNNDLGRDPIVARVFSSDADTNTFSTAEQAIIERVWQRVAEDYAPFDVDVTTELPGTMPTHTAHALVTRNTDISGSANPSSTSGGVAYIDVFGDFTYTYYSPVWIYANNLGNVEASIGEAVSHEVGHNLGLSHDGRIGGSEYYSGHGAGEISWAPIMGTGYSKNVTQWNRGEYYLADNSEDDLAIIVQDLPYRTDDHGGTRAEATPLQVVGGTQITSTTPETDPDNASPANKGILERTGDIDVFRFPTGAGAISLSIDPWVSPGGARGGNVDLVARLYDAAGTLLAEVNPVARTAADLIATVSAGIYYLEVEATGAGDPMANPPTGYTAYGCVGQYFISGTVVDGGAIGVPPQAAAILTDIVLPDLASYRFDVLYTDDGAIDTSTIDSADIRVTGPGGYDAVASLVSVDVPVDGTPRTATYAVPAPDGSWGIGDNGTYIVQMLSNAVADTDGIYVGAVVLATFECRVPEVLFAFPLDSHPGWSLDSAWEYGAPGGFQGDPTSAASGTEVLGVNLAGRYARDLSMSYVTTTPLDFSEATGVTLRFQRWLGVVAGDTAVIQISTNGAQWTSIWTAAIITIEDTQWTPFALDLSERADGLPAVQIRWGMGSNRDSDRSFGWNIDDIEFLGYPSTETQTWHLSVAPNPPEWGSVAPGDGDYADASVVELTAAANPYYRFVGWQGDIASTDNPYLVILDTNLTIEARFEAILTTAYPTPHWWLAEQGYTNDFENAVALTGLNGHPLWASYIAGLNPNDSNARLRIEHMAVDAPTPAVVLGWSTVSGRVYSVSCSTNLSNGFVPVSKAQLLPWTQPSVTCTVEQAETPGLYRVDVQLAP